MNLINEIVSHKLFGKGKIIELKNNLISINFSGEIKTFQYPKAFNGYLRAENPEIQAEMDKRFSNHTIHENIPPTPIIPPKPPERPTKPVFDYVFLGQNHPMTSKNIQLPTAQTKRSSTPSTPSAPPTLTLESLQEKLSHYNSAKSRTNRSWTMDHWMLTGYQNEYIEVLRIDSSNKWLGRPHYSEMGKMWSIIVKKKKNFSQLENYIALKHILNIKLTPVTKGTYVGNYGIRIYNMKYEPDREILLSILTFIFS